MEITHIAVDRAPGEAPGPYWSTHGAVRFAGTVTTPAGVEVHARVAPLGSGQRVDLTVRNPRRAAVALAAVRLRLEARPVVVLEHGYQSWSPVTARRVNDTRPARRWAPSWARGIWHAAPWLAGKAVTGDQFLVMGPDVGNRHPGAVAGFLDGRSHLSTVVARPGEVWAAAWLDGIRVPPGGEWSLDPLWLATGDTGHLYAEYAGHWGKTAGARTGAASPLGWCSWYQYMWKIHPNDIRANLRLAAEHGVDVVQVDDGYQRATGDWLTPRDAWSAGDLDSCGQIGALAAEVAAAGLEAGIWTAPFVVTRRSAVMADHPGWLVRDHQGRPARAMWNPLGWRGWAYALDTTNPEVLHHVEATFARLVDLGYRYHKIDFCYAAAMIGHRQGSGQATRAQALCAGIAAVRRGVGDDAFLLGCGCPLAQAVGLVDAMRVSPDTAPRWGPGLVRLPGYPDTVPAARNAVRASVLRAPLHRRLWINDPDCLIVRPSASRLTPDQRRLLATVVQGTGGFSVLSDDLRTYGSAEWALVDRLRSARLRGDHPLEIPDPLAFEPTVLCGSRHLRVRWSGSDPEAVLEDGR